MATMIISCHSSLIAKDTTCMVFITFPIDITPCRVLTVLKLPIPFRLSHLEFEFCSKHFAFAHFDLTRIILCSCKMKITISAIVVLCAAVTVHAIPAAPPCNTTALSKLLVTHNVITCRADSGYNPASMTAATDAQIDAVCTSSACTQAIKAVKQVAPNECSIGPIQLYANVIDPLEQRCGRSPGSTGSGIAGSVSAPGSGSGSTVGNVGSVSDSVSGSVGAPSMTNKPRTTAPGNVGADAPTHSTCATIAVAAVVAAIF